MIMVKGWSSEMDVCNRSGYSLIRGWHRPFRVSERTCRLDAALEQRPSQVAMYLVSQTLWILVRANVRVLGKS